ncbi:MAG: mucoidy inhibitor MuiA family protein [Proteobacteria bacterium]|nr:mucoidy inhibitor MuiA family protein [Pseudomonadota bacterium]
MTMTTTTMTTMQAPIVEVTVLEDRASITRRGTLAVPAGQTRLVIAGVSPILVDKTLIATATGARVHDVRCERERVAWVDRSGELAALDAERRALVDDLARVAAQLAAARAESAAIVDLIEVSSRELAVAAARGVAAPTANAQLAELDALDAAAGTRLVDGETRERDLTSALGRLDGRIAQARAHAGEDIARIVVDVIAEQAGDVTVTIGYVVPGCAWRPYHRATLGRTDATTGTIAWQTAACVWQATGEAWTGVALTCSLERASLGVEPPDLVDDELAARRRPETVTVESREHEHQTTGLGAASGALEVPGIDDGGIGLTLGATRVSVACDGTPHRIPVASFAAPAQLALVAIPLRSPWVHLRARLVNTGAIPLLAGPVDLIMDSGLVGRAELGFVAVGETFELGFGPDAEIRVHRSEARERDDAGLLSNWNVQTIRVAVRLSNLGASQREVIVTERIPISEVEQVEIQLAAPQAYLLAKAEPRAEAITQITARTVDERGLVSWSVELPPQGRRAVTLEYRVRSQRGVAGV